jgi:hypothetical protein
MRSVRPVPVPNEQFALRDFSRTSIQVLLFDAMTQQTRFRERIMYPTGSKLRLRDPFVLRFQTREMMLTRPDALAEELR